MFVFNNIRKKFIEKINDLFKNNKIDYIDSLTDTLIESDIELNIIEEIINSLKKKNISNLNELKEELYLILNEILTHREKKIKVQTDLTPFVMLIVGTNGVGKTTTVIKLANLLKNENKTVIVAAGDTYRAAGIEQLEYSCKRHNIQLIKQHKNADSASVIFDAFNLAKSKKIDILIADTSGRLHTNEKLMIELKKIDLSLKKIEKTAPHETLMVIDSNFGRNSIDQFNNFNKYISITGIILSKMDCTAKGGAILSLAKKNVPIKYVCHGESINDISVFNSHVFIKSLLNIKKME